ncbi:WYL domain-containing protein [Halobacteriovorax sp. HLS]|uniref:WYL domain-containing protein n=1 Tax=Halobacteriovorax sp. HLS TaxID=2234000 RepID=UPI0013E29416|nr:WYL domain-containing protein [Halobacteriovorax sp. HLS]
MHNNSLILKEEFWTFLTCLENLNETLPLKDFLILSDLDENMFTDCVAFLENLNYFVEINEVQGRRFIAPIKLEKKISLQLTFKEWLAFQAHFPKMDEDKGTFHHEVLSEKLSTIETEYAEHDLFRAIHDEEKRFELLEKIDLKHRSYLQKTDEAIKRGFVMSIELHDGRKFDYFAHKAVFIEGELCLVGEDCNDRCLVYFNILEIEELKVDLDIQYIPNYSSIEVNDFIAAIRAVSGQEERLVLKIVSSSNVDLRPSYQFLGNPYVTTNMNGDLIWAASVERSDELYEWLLSINDHIEILDPSSLKKEYLEYCQAKLETIEEEYKKAG